MIKSAVVLNSTNNNTIACDITFIHFRRRIASYIVYYASVINMVSKKA